MNVTDRFNQALSVIPNDVRLESEFNFGISDKIDRRLKELDMTQKDLACKLGKRESEVSKWLSGTHNFTVRTIAKISDALDCRLISI